MSWWDRLWFGPLNGVRERLLVVRAWWRREFGDPFRGILDALAEAYTALYVWTVNAWWLVRLKLRPVQVVAWGGRPELDLWLGSPQDARRARTLDLLARHARAMRAFQKSMVHVTLTFRDAFTPALRRANAQLRQLSEQLAAGGAR